LKTILITGGTSGIGRETALLLAAQGHRVYAASRNPPSAALPNVTYLPLDVCSPASIRACVGQVLAEAGQIDVLVNNAGYVGPAGASEEVALEDARALFETNFFGVVQMVNAVLPGMRQRRSGLIINISSVAGRVGMPPFFGFYAASKHALEGYSKALSRDLRPLGVRVALVEPGYILTNLHHGVRQPAHSLNDFAQRREHAVALNEYSMRHGRDPQQVARLIARLVNGRPHRLRYPIGADAHYALVLYALLPEKLFECFMDWLVVGGESVRPGDDDETLRRRIGFRRYLIASAPADRLIVLGLAVLFLLILAGLWALLGR
jgi:NAD(P)-dependent dehydrogenase (short-subunit alcohol dehydrogenase family)